MRPHERVHSRRCCVCQGWFKPDARAAETQKTCSEKCRRKARRSGARERRSERLDEARAAERERQARCRAKKRAVGQSSTGPPRELEVPPAVSVHLERTLDEVEANPRPSRAALREMLQVLVRACVAFGGGSP
jgi:hypothetical protein